MHPTTLRRPARQKQITTRKPYQQISHKEKLKLTHQELKKLPHKQPHLIEHKEEEISEEDNTSEEDKALAVLLKLCKEL